ncbi:hypothetical protein BCV70DRAFT_142390, partial [Testicularia cyperi]
LDQARVKLQQIEDSIIHGVLARYALGGVTTLDAQQTDYYFGVIFDYGKNGGVQNYGLRDFETRRYLEQDNNLKNFTSDSYPGLQYQLPATVPQNAALDHPAPGQQIFPIGRQPNDPAQLIEYYNQKVLSATLPVDHNLDNMVTSYYNAALLKLSSNRILYGVELAKIKFLDQKQDYCQAVKRNDVDFVRILLKDHAQEEHVLQRVLNKVDAWTKTQQDGLAYPAHTRDIVLKLFQAYLLPITLQLEVQSVFSFEKYC